MSSIDKSNRRDPIRDEPLRDPGQSLREQVQVLILETAVPWLVVAAFAIIMAIAEWIRWLLNARYAPIPVTLIAAALTVFAAWQCNSAAARAKRLKLGLKGERSVGQFLQAMLLPRDYFVIHDICIDDFNIDHVAIGPGGVFAIEVKTRSKPRRGEANVNYDGERVVVDGYAPDRNPVAQARAGADRLQEILERKAGRKVPVRPVVLFPGRFVERQPPSVKVWVLNEKAFIEFVKNEPDSLSREESRVLFEGLAQYVRDQCES